MKRDKRKFNDKEKVHTKGKNYSLIYFSTCYFLLPSSSSLNFCAYYYCSNWYFSFFFCCISMFYKYFADLLKIPVNGNLTSYRYKDELWKWLQNKTNYNMLNRNTHGMVISFLFMNKKYRSNIWKSPFVYIYFSYMKCIH